MKREVVIGFAGLIFIAMMIVAIMHNDVVQDMSRNALHEIKTADIFQQAAYPQPAGPGVSGYSGYQPRTNCPVYPNQYAQQAQVYPQWGTNSQGQPMLQQVVMPGIPPIAAGQDKPVLIKLFGCEVIPVGGGKVKITGVMGNSWAAKAGLQAGDILLSFDTKKITSLEQFQSILAAAAPEKSYKITYMRGIRVKKGVISIGEGEMEGFTPIPAPK